MRLIVDANIVFSGILNGNGKIGDLLMNSKKYFEFIAPDFLRIEIQKHYLKLCKISKLPLENIKEAEFQIYKHIEFVSEEQIKIAHWLSSEKLVADIDPKDAQYVAFSKHFRCKLWSGDKELMKGLELKNFKNFITTEQLYQLKQSLTK